MKPLRLLALSIAATAWLAAAAYACPGAKSADASACCSKASATKTASAQGSCSAHAKTTAVTAAAQGACPATANCPMGSEACKAKMASGGCPYAQGATATAAAAGNCTMHAMAAHSDCDVCTDEMACGEDLTALGAHEQVVGLRNGTMIVYTADHPEDIRALQTAVARYNDRVVEALSGSKAKLCASCKRLRGALASGKLVREVVNVERGCQLIITSSDRSIVQQVHATTNAQLAARTRS